MMLQRPQVDSELSWKRHFVYRAERTRTTWKLRLILVVIVLLTIRQTAGWWTGSVGRSLVCDEIVAPSDAILLENFGPNDLLFERARRLREGNLATRVLVTIWSGNGSSEMNPVALHTAEAMARTTGLGSVEFVPVTRVEPYSLNAARAVQRYLQREHITSVIVVTELFRSRRTELIYNATLGGAGIRVYCQPVAGTYEITTWPRGWHGIQEVAEQWFKLQYYRFYALPFSDPIS